MSGGFLRSRVQIVSHFPKHKRLGNMAGMVLSFLLPLGVLFLASGGNEWSDSLLTSTTANAIALVIDSAKDVPATAELGAYLTQ